MKNIAKSIYVTSVLHEAGEHFVTRFLRHPCPVCIWRVVVGECCSQLIVALAEQRAVQITVLQLHNVVDVVHKVHDFGWLPVDGQFQQIIDRLTIVIIPSMLGNVFVTANNSKVI